MKVCDLSGALLDYWVLRAEGWVDDRLQDMQLTRNGEYCIAGAAPKHAVSGHCWRSPSTDWAVAGPLIEREEISVYASVDWKSERQHSLLHWVGVCERIFTRRGYIGPTPLVAAMRAFVASKFGEEVPDV